MIKSRNGFTQVDLLVSLVVIVGLAALQLPAINASRAAAQRNACMNNLRGIGLALHNYHDVYKKFPTLDDGHLLSLKTASAAGETATRFSWHVRILPYLEKSALYFDISNSSNRFKLPAFDAQIAASKVHPASIAVPGFICDAFQGKPVAAAKEFEALGQAGPQADGRGVAINNYVALPATHLTLMEQKPSQPNGVLVPERSTKMFSVRDGTSRTVVVAESKEQHYSSWYDATCTWVVGVPSEETQPKAEEAGRWRAAPGTPSPLNYGPSKNAPDRVYLAQKRWANSEPRRWGPSSDHPGDIVMHLFADGATRPLNADIGATVYLALITRAGNDTIRDDLLEKLGIVDKPTTRIEGSSPENSKSGK